MYNSILMNLEVFPIFISSPHNLTLKIPKMVSKIFLVHLVVENDKFIIYDYLFAWTDYRVLGLGKVCQKF